MYKVLCCLCVLVAAATGFTEHDHNKLPRLYHLDNYDRCLAQPGGLYCLGTFRLSAKTPNAAYDYLKEYSSEPHHFDRTLLHRGYCLSARCPTGERNTSRRFERCVEQHVLDAGLSTALQSYSCSSDPQEDISSLQTVFLVVVCVLLFLNAIGTLYDFASQGQEQNKYLLAWSLRANWRRFIRTHEDSDARIIALAPVHGLRMMFMMMVMITHALELFHKVYLYNPEYFEQVLLHPATMFIRNGSPLVQSFFVLSNFLFGYSLLLYSKQRRLKFAHFPLFVLHRVIRFLAVDMQLYIVASILMLYLMTGKRNPIRVLTLLFLLASLLNAALAYIYEWKSMMYIAIPENLRVTFRGVSSFTQLYISPWGSLPACLAGLLAAHIHFYMQEQEYKITQHKWFVSLVHLSVPLHAAWLLAGNVMLQYSSRAATSAYVAVERPMVALLAVIGILGFANNVDNKFHRLMSWRGWSPLVRMSLALLMVHWPFNAHLVGTRRTLSEASFLTVMSDTLSTMFWSCLVALPLTLLVEAPVKSSFSALISSYL